MVFLMNEESFCCLMDFGVDLPLVEIVDIAFSMLVTDLTRTDLAHQAAAKLERPPGL